MVFVNGYHPRGIESVNNVFQIDIDPALILYIETRDMPLIQIRQIFCQQRTVVNNLFWICK